MVLAAGRSVEGHPVGMVTQYESVRPELPVSFEYPADWDAEESFGSQEAYAQVQVYAPESLESRLRSYLVIRAVPPEEKGGRYAGLRAMADSYRHALQPGLQIDQEEQTNLLGASAVRFRVSGTLRLPWKSSRAQPVPVRSERIFFEKGGRLYELAWMATPEAADQVRDAFIHLLETLTWPGHPAERR